MRTSYRMTIDLDDTDSGTRSGRTESRRARFEPGDEQVFYELHQETFRDSWEPIEETYDEWAHQFLAPEVLAPALWTLAVAGEEPPASRCAIRMPWTAELGWVRVLGVRRPFRGRGLGRALLLHAFAQFRRLGLTRAGLGVDRDEPDRREQALRVGRDARLRTVRDLREGRDVSSLRARCPNCRTFTAVAIGDGYECHSCGSTFAAGLVRVPAAWGSGGEAMAEGARIALPYPEVAVVERDTLDEQTAAVADVARRPADRARWLLLHARGGVRASRDESTASASSGSTLTATSTRPRRRRPEICGGCRFA